MMLKDKIDIVIQRICDKTGRKFVVNRSRVGLRFGTCDYDISPILDPRNMLVWLEAFENGLYWSEADRFKGALNSAPELPIRHLTDATPRSTQELMQWGAEYIEWYNNNRVQDLSVKISSVNEIYKRG